MRPCLLLVCLLVAIANTNSSWIDVVFPYRSNCRRKLSVSSGSIQSPLYPNPYPWNVDCEWQITAPEGSNVWLLFQDFDLNTNVDHVRIYDGVDTTAPLLATLTGAFTAKNRAHPFMSSGSTLVLKFTSTLSASRIHKGFSVDFRNKAPGCGGSELVLSAPSGSIRSVNYPQDYPPDLFWCTTIEMSHEQKECVQKRLHLTILSFQTYDDERLEIYAGNKASESKRIASFSGSDVSLPQTVSSESNMFLTFNSTSNHQILIPHSYYATYRTKCDCDQTFTDDCGTIEALGNNSNCRFLIQVEEGYSIILVLHEYYLFGTSNLVIYDGATENDSQLMRFTGSSSGSSSGMSSGSSMLIKFTADPRVCGSRFTAAYTKF